MSKLIHTPAVWYDDWYAPEFLFAIRDINPEYLVIVNGVFDILGAQHIALLRAAYARALLHDEHPYILVALNTDLSVLDLRGRAPYVPFVQRAALLASICYVDAVVGFNEMTPEALVRLLQPRLLVKGDEYEGTVVPGSEHCEEVYFAPMHPAGHTSDLVKRILERNKTQ